MNEVFTFRRSGRSTRRVIGRFEATGVVPRFAELLRARGVDLSVQMFRKPEEVSE
jgi:pilus assembly protein CpaF